MGVLLDNAVPIRQGAFAHVVNLIPAQIARVYKVVAPTVLQMTRKIGRICPSVNGMLTAAGRELVFWQS
jgi:hypothetical protein